MQQVMVLDNDLSVGSARPMFAVDTSFVLFFLAFELFSSASASLTGNALSLATIAAFAAVPYLLPATGERPAFWHWLAGRVAIALLAGIAGYLFGRAVGGLLPGSARYLPMALLIASAVVSCFTQLYAILHLRLAR